MSELVCGYYAVNQHHCIIHGRCVVCREAIDG
jgi:hypothetical protein